MDPRSGEQVRTCRAGRRRPAPVLCGSVVGCNGIAHYCCGVLLAVEPAYPGSSRTTLSLNAYKRRPCKVGRKAVEGTQHGERDTRGLSKSGKTAEKCPMPRRDPDTAEPN